MNHEPKKLDRVRPQNESLGRDEWWVDLMEGETEDSLRQDLNLLLMNSRADRERLQELKDLRELIKDSDEVLLPEDGRVYDDMHDRIMAAIDGTVPQKPKRPLSRISPRQLGFPSLFGTSALTILIACLAWLSTNKQNSPTPADTDSKLMAAYSTASPDSIMDEVLSPTDEDEFFAEVASRKLERMNESEIEAVLHRLRE